MISLRRLSPLALAFTLAAAAPAMADNACEQGINFANPDGFAPLVEQVMPSTVSIYVKIQKDTPAAANNNSQTQQMPQLPPGSPYEKFFKKFEQQPPAPRQGEALGSGFVIEAGNGYGYIATNNHVAGGEGDMKVTDIKVKLHDGTMLDAELVGADPDTDLAVIKVKTDHPLTAVQFADSDKVKIGSWAVAIGNPLGRDDTVTAGIVSQKHRKLGGNKYEDFIQTDAAINRGNSGGALFNLHCKVIGVNSAILSPSGGSIGLGYSISANLVKKVTHDLSQYGEVKRGWLGVSIQGVDEATAKAAGMAIPHGAVVSGVAPGGPAEKAGLQSGDIITEFNGKQVSTMSDLPLIVSMTPIGQQSEMKVLRNGQEITANVTLGDLKQGLKQMQPQQDPIVPLPAPAPAPGQP